MDLQQRLSLLRKVGFGVLALTAITAAPAHAQSTFVSMGGAWSGDGPCNCAAARSNAFAAGRVRIRRAAAQA